MFPCKTATPSRTCSDAGIRAWSPGSTPACNSDRRSSYDRRSTAARSGRTVWSRSSHWPRRWRANCPSPVGNSKEGTSSSGVSLRQRIAQHGHGAFPFAGANRVDCRGTAPRFGIREAEWPPTATNMLASNCLISPASRHRLRPRPECAGTRCATICGRNSAEDPRHGLRARNTCPQRAPRCPLAPSAAEMYSRPSGSVLKKGARPKCADVERGLDE